MATFKREITFQANDSLEAAAVTNALHDILQSISEKKHLVELGKIIKNKPGLIQKAIPFLGTLKFL